MSIPQGPEIPQTVAEKTSRIRASAYIDGHWSQRNSGRRDRLDSGRLLVITGLKGRSFNRNIRRNTNTCSRGLASGTEPRCAQTNLHPIDRKVPTPILKARRHRIWQTFWLHQDGIAGLSIAPCRKHHGIPSPSMRRTQNRRLRRPASNQ